jgi:hypothetical protein
MNRMQFSLTLFAAGLYLAFLGSKPTLAQETGWDPREDKSVLFNQQAGPPTKRSVSLDMEPTLKKWARSGFHASVQHAIFKTGFVRGVRTSLLFPDNSSTGLADCFVSVQTGGNDFNHCSTTNGQASSSCSVSGSNPAGNCSVNGVLAPPTYCSAGAEGSPTNNYPTNCSAMNNTNASKCSITATDIDCSTQSGQGGSGGTTCSTTGGSGQSCSTGTLAGPTGGNLTQTDECSALQNGAGVAGQTGNFCSVSGSGAQGSSNVCSADGTHGGFCSADTSNAADFCSVMQNQNNVQCTVINNNGAGSCSCRNNTKGNGNCSVQGVNNSTNPYKGGMCPP